MDNKALGYEGIDFSDPDDYAPETEICSFCGSESDERIGYNKKMDLLKRACSNCGAIYIEDGEGEIIILKGEKRNWGTYLKKNFIFPFEAVVDEASDEEVFGFGDPGPIRYKDRVTVTNTDFEDDIYGVIAEIKKGRKKYSFPLCDLAVVDNKSPNYKLLDDYRTWFANCR
ncbi:MAG: calcium-binding protein [Clostridiales bacterium]|jgi:hypothetical protein|nr:calcium-binding protein [Clostridiales bacterium]